MFPVRSLKKVQIIKCNCEIYKFLRNSLQEEDNDNPELDPATSCMHCRFFHDHLMDAYAKIISIQFKLAATIGHGKKLTWNNVFTYYTTWRTCQTGATKFSVNGNDTCYPHFCVRSLLHKMSQRDVWSIKHKQEEDAQVCSPWPNA